MMLNYSKYTIANGVQKVKTKTTLSIMALGLILGGGGGLSLAMLGTTHAAPINYTLFGSATQQASGVHLVSNSTQAYSGITLNLPSGTTVNSINDLETSFQVITGTCYGGSPRFSVVTPAGNIFVYPGAYPNFTSCSSGATGNLLAGPDLRVDTSQIAGGTFYDSWAHAQALVGSQAVTELDIVVDSGWHAPQELVFTSATVNSTNYNFVPPVLVGSVTGGLTLSNPRQQISFNAFDYGANSLSDYGTVEYQNFDYTGGLHYTANIQCVTVTANDARFMFQIPPGHPGLSGLYVVVSVHDGGSPAKKFDTYGHTATSNLATAMSWCENGVATTSYTITGGNLVVHKQ